MRLRITDIAIIVAVVVATQLIWFGLGNDDLRFNGASSLDPENSALSLLLILGWASVLGLYGSRDDRIIGTGSAEYKAIIDASLRTFGLFAIIAFLFRVDFSRGYFFVALPLGTLALLFSRWLWRKWLNRRRREGGYSARVVLVGSRASVQHTARELSRQPYAGYHVVGVCLAQADVDVIAMDSELKVLGGVDDVRYAMKLAGADTVIVTSSDELSPEKIRDLSWSLEPGRQHLVVSPSLTDIGGPRIHTRPVAGLPLIHVETARYDGFKKYQKRAFDVTASGLLIAFLSPVLLAIAIVIRLSTPGDVFFRQQRVGLHGEVFYMLKFRSMVPNAESLLTELTAQDRVEGNTVLFKMKDDPRVTPIGKLLRRYSLDELPQLFNVFRGEMSLIGPRPPLEREVELYESHVHRRFMMKPGITGLWQVSGRSNLSWEDSVRLDLYYVENWSMVTDFQILLRTARAVVSSDGAY